MKTWKATASWPLAPCEGPTGIAYDKATNRIFSGCNGTSVVVDREYRQGGGDDHERHARRRARLGSGEEADLHSEWRRGQRHGRPPGFGRTSTPSSRRSTTFRRREDDRRRSEDPQRVSVPARARSGAAAGRRRAAAADRGADAAGTAGADRRGAGSSSSSNKAIVHGAPFTYSSGSSWGWTNVEIRQELAPKEGVPWPNSVETRPRCSLRSLPSADSSPPPNGTLVHRRPPIARRWRR